MNNQLIQDEYDEQERQTNRRILVGFRYYLIMFAVIYVLCIIGFFELDVVIMTVTLAIVIPLACVAFSIGSRFDLSANWIKYVYMVIICLSTGVITSILTVHAVLLHILPLLFALQCRRKKVLWFTYIVNTLTIAGSSLLGFYYGICDLNILIKSNLRRVEYLQSYSNGLVHLPLNDNTFFIILVFEVLPQSMILLVFTLMLRSTMVRSMEDIKRITDLTWRKERDANTGVFNKNKYQEMLDDYYFQVERVSAIYWDLNNLKLTNDKYGHAEGDALIGLLAKCLMEQGDERYRVFRLGGDEFLLVIDDPRIGETDSAIAEIKEKMTHCKTPKGLPLSSAVGWSTGEGKNIHQVVKSADADMYANKIAQKKLQQEQSKR